MNQKFFRKISVLSIVSMGLLALVQWGWTVKMYTDQIEDFRRRVESAAYKSIYKAFRMDAIPGLQAAEQINIDLVEFALHFEPNLLELDIKEPYMAEILEVTEDGNRTLMQHSSTESPGTKVHTCTIPIDDDGMFALRLTIRLPYGQFVGNMWGLLLCSALIVVILSGILFWMVRAMFRQRSLEEMRHDFTNNITHELKTPISVAMAATDALRNFSAEANPQRRNRYMQIIETQLEQLATMVERILLVSVQGHKAKINKEKIHLSPIISHLTEEVKMGSETQLQIEIECPQELEAEADPMHLKNVLSTLIDNAVKYSQKTSVNITVSAWKDASSNVCISIADNGCGISKEHLPHIFEKYYRIPQGDIQQVRGYGLGLFYAKQTIEQHGGRITVESRPKQGTKFTIILPQQC